MERALLLDVVVRERTPILQLFTSEDETLLVRWDTLLVLNLRLDVVDCVGALNFQCDRLPSERLNEDLHTTTETEDEVKSGFFLDVVIRQGTAIFELLSGENETLLIRRNTLLVLNLRLHIIDRIRGFYLQRNGLSSESLDENLHTTTKAEHQVKGRFLLNVVVGQSAAILELLTSEDQALLVRRNALLILDLGLHIVDSVARLHLEGDSLTSEGLHNCFESLVCRSFRKVATRWQIPCVLTDLHSTTQTENKVKGRLLLNVVVGEGAAVFKLLSRKNQALLVGRNALLVLDLGLDVVNGVAGLDLKSDGLARNCREMER